MRKEYAVVPSVLGIVSSVYRSRSKWNQTPEKLCSPEIILSGQTFNGLMVILDVIAFRGINNPLPMTPDFAEPGPSAEAD